MEKTITIYHDTHREACTCNVSDADTEIFDANIERYYDFLRAELAKRGYELEVSTDTLGGRSWHCNAEASEDDATITMGAIQDFWGWYN